MKIEKYIIYLFVLIAVLLTSCSNDDTDFGEQYKKTIFFVNSQGMLYTDTCACGENDNVLTYSVYCASSEPIKSDLTITLSRMPEALDSLNHLQSLGNPLYVPKVLMPEINYTFEDSVVTIKAGQQYGLLKVPYIMTGLDPDQQYALPLKIVSNSQGYDVNKDLNIIIIQIKRINGYSGEFSGCSIELPNSIIRSVVPVLEAMSANTLRMPIHTLSSDVTFHDTNFMILKIAGDSTAVTIEPWMNAIVTDLGGSTYDKKKLYFDLNYSFTDSLGREFIIHEKIGNMEYKDDGDDE